MHIGPLACAIVIAAMSHAGSQGPKPKKDDDRPTIVVTGCLDGSWLRVDHVAGAGPHGERYKLRGSKQLMKEIQKNYNGHSLEVTGAVTDNGNTTHRGKTFEVGKKTRIYTGAKEVPEQPTGTGDPTLEITSFRDLKDRCK